MVLPGKAAQFTQLLGVLYDLRDNTVNMAYWKRWLRELSRLKVNQVMIFMGDTLRRIHSWSEYSSSAQDLGDQGYARLKFRRLKLSSRPPLLAASIMRHKL
jgi:hypothetical protein